MTPTPVTRQVEASLFAVLQRKNHLKTKSRKGVLCVFLYPLPTFCRQLDFFDTDGPDPSFEEVRPCH